MVKLIKRALISVSDKTDLELLVRALDAHGVELISTGGTARHIAEMGPSVRDISEFTGFPEMLDGRVKTLHPHVHGGILAIRDDVNHQTAVSDHDMRYIDLVVVNLYPFESTIARGADFATCIENIDIGGPSMVRSAAKNHNDVAVVVDPSDYSKLIDELSSHDGGTTDDFRRYLAAKAFSRTAAYDATISNWFMEKEGITFPDYLTLTGTLQHELRYGENPDQAAAVYATHSIPDRLGIPGSTLVQGKALSYNNINDADAALELVSEFQEPTAAIIKHANPCGIASDSSILTAYEKALACDPVSAFGGIIAINRPLTTALAERILSMFVEVVVVPEADDSVRELFHAKKNVRLLVTGKIPDHSIKSIQIKSIAQGLLLQQRDTVKIGLDDVTCVTSRKPTATEEADLLFAYSVCKHVKSNAIVFAKDCAAIGIGAGQMSRVDSVRIAAMKSLDHDSSGARAQGAVAASDAFFPFADGLLAAADAGITAVIQPGGSVRDEEVIEAANARNIAMLFTGGKRHFKH